MQKLVIIILVFFMGAILGHSIKKTDTIKVISSPVEMIIEEDCFMDNHGERLQMKRLKIEDLNKDES